MTNSESEDRWQGYVAVPEIRRDTCDGCDLEPVKCFDLTDKPYCTDINRKDKRNIIWKKETTDG